MDSEEKIDIGTKMNLVDAVFAAGVVGQGGAGFPTHVKLKARAKTFIINAAECEPLIAIDKYLCRHKAEEIIAAAMLIASHLGAERTIIALKETYSEEINQLEKAIIQLKAPVELHKMKPFYPAGDEQTMVQDVTGRSIPERGLPLDVGAVVDNVGTVLAVRDAVQGRPVTHKILSVVGEVAKPVILNVPIGTAIDDCIALAGPRGTDYAVIVGGPMMGRVLTGREEIDAQVVTKTTGNLLVLPKDHYLIRRSRMSLHQIKRQAVTACIQCRQCTDLCPRHLIGHCVEPHMVMRNFFKEDFLTDSGDYIRAFGSAVNCCDCGVCEMFACPMGLSPRKVNGYFKNQLREKKLEVPKEKEPVAKASIAYKRIPTARLTARLGLSSYKNQKIDSCHDFESDTVCIPLKMHIGSTAKPVVNVGNAVPVGGCIAAAGPGLSANVHSSISGTVTSVAADKIVITRKGV